MPQSVYAFVQSQIDQFTISGTTPASASTAAVGSTVTGLGRFRSMMIVGSLVGATGGTLDVYLQTSPDGGVTWVDYAHFQQLAAGAGSIVKLITVSRSGQSNITATSSAATAQPAVVTVGTGTTPALAAGVCIGGDFGDRIRCIATAGASTSAGAAITIFISGTT